MILVLLPPIWLALHLNTPLQRYFVIPSTKFQSDLYNYSDQIIFCYYYLYFRIKSYTLKLTHFDSNMIGSQIANLKLKHSSLSLRHLNFKKYRQIFSLPFPVDVIIVKH